MLNPPEMDKTGVSEGQSREGESSPSCPHSPAQQVPAEPRDPCAGMGHSQVPSQAVTEAAAMVAAPQLHGADAPLREQDSC